MNEKFEWSIEFEGNQILLKNVRFNQYIYAANNYFNYDNDRRRVFTWKPGEKVTQGYWTVENCDTLSKVERGSKRSMRKKVNHIPMEELQENFRNIKYSQVCIKNVKFQERLYYDYDIREISSRVQKDSQSLWKLEHSRDSLFYIRHVKSNKYLCSGYGQYHQYGREITTLDGAYKDSKCEWGLDTQNRIVNFDSQEALFAAPSYFNYEKGKRRILTLVYKNDIAEYNNSSYICEQSIQGSTNDTRDYVCSIEPLVIDRSNAWMIENCNSKSKKINHYDENIINKNTPKRMLRDEKRIKCTASNLDVSDNLIKSERSKYSWFSNLTIGIKNIVNRLNFSKTKESLSDYENSSNIIKKWNSENINNSHLHEKEGFDLNGNLMLAHVMINKFPLNKLFLRRKESVQKTPNLEDRKQNDKSMLQEQTIVDISRTQNRSIKPSTLIGNVTIDTAVDKRRVI
ncbi:MAG: hypothetical protein KTV77_05520 [Wolbachia endosymbiont of Fragariocoptes setiger]|nr:hypothetical protein [Wolbachia endosymbiont of Fragariocoptes setiger]